MNSLADPDGESFECFGENEMLSSTMDANASNGGVDLELVASHLQKYENFLIFKSFKKS